TMVFAPATFARLSQVVPLVIGLPALTPMALDGLMQLVLSVLDAGLSLIWCFRERANRSARQHQSRPNRRRQQQRSSFLPLQYLGMTHSNPPFACYENLQRGLMPKISCAAL